MFSKSTTTFPPPRAVATRQLNTARHFTLPYLIVLSMTTLILAVIYAACVGQNNHSRSQLLHPQPTTNVTLASAPANHRERSALVFPGIYPYTRTNATTPSSSTSTSTTNPHYSSVALVFYSVTLPLSTLLHTFTESIILKFRPDLLTHSKSHSIPYFLLATSILLAAGWTVTTAFWTHCELALTHSAICPAQVRNHLMYGILELSIAKAAIGWALLAGYTVHVFFLVRWMRVCKRWQGISGWAGRLEWEPEDKEGMEVGFDERALELSASQTKITAKVSAVTVAAAVQEARLEKQQQQRKMERPGPPKEVPSFPPPPTKPFK